MCYSDFAIPRDLLYVQAMSNQPLKYGGFCVACQEQHTLNAQQAIPIAQALIAELETTKTINKNCPEGCTDILFGKARGQMFGVMLARNSTGDLLTLKAFSGQFNGQYSIEGWAPPIFNVEAFHAINTPEERNIKAISQRISETQDSTLLQSLKRERRERSRTLMKKIHQLYKLRNFHGEEKAMEDFFLAGKGMPTGAGDCCGPKLIHQANSLNLTPLSMIEFYFGLENKSKTRQHGHFYSSCTSNCAPILGFMLCGLPVERDELGVRREKC